MKKLIEMLAINGLSLKSFGNGHYRITGGKYLVNYYPRTRRGPTAYIDGMVSGRTLYNAELADVVRLALRGYEIQVAAKERFGPKKNAAIRRKLFLKSRLCHYCKAELKSPSGNDCHLDHRIPLSKGGGNFENNMVLACVDCDVTKKNKMPHEFAAEKASNVTLQVRPNRETPARVT